jgi:DNA-binding transcriptional LysR family regulator
MDWYTSMLNFVRTVDTGSLANAARELDVVPSAISKSLTRLEQSAGVQLLERSTRTLVPTKAGWAFYLAAKQAVGMTQAAFDTIKPMENDGREAESAP